MISDRPLWAEVVKPEHLLLFSPSCRSSMLVRWFYCVQREDNACMRVCHAQQFMRTESLQVIAIYQGHQTWGCTAGWALYQSEWAGYDTVTNSPNLETIETYFYLMPQAFYILAGCCAIHHLHVRDLGWSLFHHLGYCWLLWQREWNMIHCI